MPEEPRRPKAAAGRLALALEALGRSPDGAGPEELSTQVRQLALGQRRLRRLLDAVVAMSEDMDLRAVLRHIVEAATDLVGARYGALGVLGSDGEFVDLITVGVDEERMLAESGLPQGHGLLVGLLADLKPMRVADVGADPRSVGFPVGHPMMTTLLGVPLMVRGRAYGNLYLADKSDGAPFTDDDEAILTALASVASVSIENARLYEDLKQAAMHFQLRMLPELPDLSPLAVEVRYEPASELPRLGGDWYDALTLPDGAVCLVVGDVTGHAVAAAPVMGQIRNMLRALAYDHGGPPSLVVTKLDRALTMFTEPPTATLVLARVEHTGGEYVLRWSNAGHPPPLLVEADGTTHFLAPARHGLPVGVEPSFGRYDDEHRLPAGSTLLLFTDGLVERRGEDIDATLAELADQAARLAGVPLRRLCAELVTGRGQLFDDDVTLLALRLPGEDPVRTSGRATGP
ncbi:Serine phosphatase RsbU, regulator of sigma subunit [Streptomyces misionensis]|uniref:Serine phosphatase RsbU, regulator of sigma subunit n=1 Tax=Streptomyces misionensis TaxID=67331 RepID=A0A1H5GW56_9ACTN|nr:GAF domain-containing SpoIIE family protein phosphatase [Streptomyces misionensis]SEE19946.1 Serine phosphatase RsbU, regulator of sigma subunit [Streptomyces misionensis]